MEPQWVVAPESLIGGNILDHIGNIAASTPLGAIAEVGVYKGGSAFILAQYNPDRPLYLYDTFAGIPEKTNGLDIHQVGDFGDTTLEQVKASLPNAIFCVGVFPSTFIPASYAFVHVDCDQYESVKACIETFTPHMIPGGKMWFDDYKCLPGATKAIEESGRSFEVVMGKALMSF